MKTFMAILGFSMLSMTFLSANINEETTKKDHSSSEESVQKDFRGCKKCRR